MLNIPSIVTARLKRDDVQKNFRVSFPNGEYNDITNDNIVYESVKLSESICSRDSFRFGLAESSRIEFETVGIGNMLGMEIQCFCEVDLTGENISSILNWNGDGETIPLASSDLGYAFFRIPYGQFVVHSCPRNHEAMTHRQVTAYSTLFHNNSYMCPFEQKKTSADWNGAKVYSMNLKHFIAENLAYYDESILAQFGYTTKEQLFSFSSMTEYSISNGFEFYNSSNSLVMEVTVSENYRSRNLSETGTVGAFDGLLEFVLPNYDTDSPFNFVKTALDSRSTIDYSRTIIQSATRPTIELYDSDDAMLTLIDRYIMPRVRFSEITASGTGTYRQTVKNSYFIFTGDKTAKCFYPNMTNSGYNLVDLYFPYNVQITIHDYVSGTTTTQTFNPTNSINGFKCNKYIDSRPALYLGGKRLDFNATLGQSLDERDIGVRSFVNAFSFAKICRGFCELNGLFLTADRNGGVKLFSLSALPGSGGQTDIELSPADYSELWWDEYDVEPVGQIEYCYTTKSDFGNETQTNTLIIGDGGSVYDMTDNYVLENLGDSSQSNVESIIQTNFVPNLGNISFTPFELSCCGIPQLEAGDRLKLVAADNSVIYSYALQCELGGIQNLQEQIQASVGDIISDYGEDDE